MQELFTETVITIIYLIILKLSSPNENEDLKLTLNSAIYLFQVKVNVMDKNDSPPKFFELPPAINVSEDLGAGHEIATIAAVDPDTIGSLTFSLVDDDGDVDNKFELEEETGVLRLRDTLDREAKDVYRLTMRVSDGVQSTDAIVNIQV